MLESVIPSYERTAAQNAHQFHRMVLVGLLFESLHYVLATVSAWGLLLLLPQCDDMHIRVIEQLYIYSGGECAWFPCVRAGQLRNWTCHHFITGPTAETQIYWCQLTFMHVKVEHLKGGRCKRVKTCKLHL